MEFVLLVVVRAAEMGLEAPEQELLGRADPLEQGLALRRVQLRAVIP